MVPQLSKTYPGMEIEDAYEVQRLWAEGRTAKGAGVVGHKIGLTSRAMQKASKMTEADYCRILDDAFFHDGAQIDAGIFIKPRLEVELAFVMGTDLEGRGCQIHDVMRATEFVVPALEIIDYRTEVPPAIVDTIADNAAFGAIVTGGRMVRPFDVDIRWIGATLSQNGVIEESGVSAAVMGHPRLVGVETMCRRQRKHDCPIAKIHWSLLVARSIADPCAIREGAWQQWLRRPQMIRGFVSDNGRLQRVEGVMDRLDQVLWMDLLNPTKEEEADLERRLGIDIPTREEMEEIEISSRLYQEDGAAFMTATLPAQVDLAEPRIAPVTFVLAGERLITVRYHEPRAFQTFPARAEKVPMGCGNGEAVLIALLEALSTGWRISWSGPDATSTGFPGSYSSSATRSRPRAAISRRSSRKLDATAT